MGSEVSELPYESYISHMTVSSAIATLEWLVESGADEVVEEAPINRYLEERQDLLSSSSNVIATNTRDSQLASITRRSEDFYVSNGYSGKISQSLLELRKSVEEFDGCPLKRTATKTVFSDGNPEAKLMLIGEAPGAEEDRKGVPFVGAAGHLLDRMLAAIDLDRKSAYITNIVFWRPPGNRNPNEEEINLCLPFVKRHIALIRPRVLVLVGAIAAQTVLGKSEGISRLRGKWYSYQPEEDGIRIDTTAIFHPAFLLRQNQRKREAWQDLIAIRERLTSDLAEN